MRWEPSGSLVNPTLIFCGICHCCSVLLAPENETQEGWFYHFFPYKNEKGVEHQLSE